MKSSTDKWLPLAWLWYVPHRLGRVPSLVTSGDAIVEETVGPWLMSQSEGTGLSELQPGAASSQAFCFLIHWQIWSIPHVPATGENSACGFQKTMSWCESFHPLASLQGVLSQQQELRQVTCPISSLLHGGSIHSAFVWQRQHPKSRRFILEAGRIFNK